MLVALLALANTCPAFAQDRDPAARQVQAGRTKVWIGVAAIAAGALIVPVTNTNGNHDPGNASIAASLGLVAGGSVLLWYGFHQQQAAVRPSTGFAFGVSRGGGAVRVRRSW